MFQNESVICCSVNSASIKSTSFTDHFSDKPNSGSYFLPKMPATIGLDVSIVSIYSDKKFSE